MARIDPITGKPERKRAWSDDKYKTVVKELRRYATGFNAKDGYSLGNIKKLTPARKRRIKKYGQFLIEIAYSERKVYRPRNKANLKIAKAASGIPKGFGAFKVAFLHVDDREAATKFVVTKPKKPEDKPQIKAVQPTHTRFYGLIDRDNFILDPGGEITRVATELEKAGAVQFGLRAGEHLMMDTVTTYIPFLVEDTLKLINKYGAEKVAQWLLSIQGMSTKTPEEIKPGAERSILRRFKTWGKKIKKKLTRVKK